MARRSEAKNGADAERASAFRRLADEHLLEAYKLANAILANPAEAQDAVHDAFVRAWDKWASLRDPSRFAPWFRRIVVNTCRNRLKAESRRSGADLAVGSHLSTPDASGEVHAREQVERALRQLRPDDRVVLALRYYRDLRVEDIADLLGIPSGTATSRLRAAHARLRAVMERTDD